MCNTRTFWVNFKRIGMREYKIDPDGLAILRCEVSPDGQTLRTEPCPFCKAKYHIHGVAHPGHKARHCAHVRISLPDGSVISNFNGYILKLVSNLGEKPQWK